MMKTKILILSLLCSGLNAGAQQAYLSREEYRDKVEAYSQILKQQHLKTFASTEARKIASTGFLPQIDITAEGTANLNHLDQWNSPKGDYRPYTYQALASLRRVEIISKSVRLMAPSSKRSWMMSYCCCTIS